MEYFEGKEESTIRQIIDYCRRLEKEEKGKGVKELDEIMKESNKEMVDAIKNVITHPNTEYKFIIKPVING